MTNYKKNEEEIFLEEGQTYEETQSFQEYLYDRWEANQIADYIASPRYPIDVQYRRTNEITPILVDLLNSKLTNEYQGENYTAIFEPNTQILSCYRSETQELISQSEFGHKFYGKSWYPSSIPLLDSKKPNLSDRDIEFFEKLAPQLEKHQEQYRQVYLTHQSYFSDLEPTELDTAIALSMLEENHSIDRVCLTLNQSDTFKKLSPAEAIDYRQQIIDDALRLQQEQENTEEIDLD